MSVRIVRLPDVGEGVAEAELVAWYVAVGDAVTSDTVVAEVLTDKATVEIYAPVAGTIAELHGEAGDVLAVGSDFVAIETGEVTASTTTLGDTSTEPIDSSEITAAPPHATTPPTAPRGPATVTATAPPGRAAPAVRERARMLGIDLGEVNGSGPQGRVTHDDLDRHTERGASGVPSPASTQIPLIGLRRKIAERMATASTRIPHITYVDEIDMTGLERLRQSLTTEYPEQRLTVLPFMMRAIVLSVADRPRLNATFDDEQQVLTTYAGVNIGIATQTDNGLIVPVVRDAQTMDLWRSAAELERVTAAARDGTASRRDLSGSTITVTSLGAIGGLVTTPIINHPEVAIVGINKMQTRPFWNGDSFVPRTMMNLSCSFDHRIVDGWDAATFVQRVKVLLEEPGLLFVERPRRPESSRPSSVPESRTSG